MAKEGLLQGECLMKCAMHPQTSDDQQGFNAAVKKKVEKKAASRKKLASKKSSPQEILDKRTKLVVWRFTDGKPGHESQTEGLISALQRRLPVAVYDLPARPGTRTLIGALFRQWPNHNDLPKPDLIVGAGHRTHSSMLAAQRAYGGRTVLMMSPTLPYKLFDLCLVPLHDAPPTRRNVLPTQGVLNNISGEGAHRIDKTLILIGGPSRHHGWDDQAMIGQLNQLLEKETDQRFLLTTSRRTPSSFMRQLENINHERLQIVPVADTAPGWVANQLADSARAWVSEDSVSMIYEALTAGVAVGLLDVPRLKSGRVTAGVDVLIKEHWVTPYARWRSGLALKHAAKAFNEAERCADWICDRWLKNRSI